MSPHHLSDHDRREIAHELDEIVKSLSERYGVSPHEVVSAVRWVQEKKEHDQKMKNAALFALIGTIMTSLAIALWEGYKVLAGR